MEHSIAEGNKLTSFEVAKVFALYLGCKCQQVATIRDENGKYNLSLGGVITLSADMIEDIENQYRSYKLCLTPVEEMTAEHKIHILRIADYKYLDRFNEKDNLNLFDHVFRVHFKQGKYRHDIYLQLLKWGYDVKLWFGLDHWANGLTATILRLTVITQ